MAILRIHQASTAMEWADAEGLPWIVAFIIGDCFMLFGVTALMATQVSTQTCERFGSLHVGQRVRERDLSVSIGNVI